MPLTLKQCFGVNATQNDALLIISKQDLPRLTPTSNNTAESLVVGIILKILENFEGKLTTALGETITDEKGIPITYEQGDIFDVFYLFNWRVIFRTKQGNDYRITQFVLQTISSYP